MSITATFTPFPITPKKRHLSIKRAVDIIFSLNCILLSAPLLLFFALCVASDGGPIFYRQARGGHHGRSFTILKFRSMKQQAQADAILQQATRRDRRFTWIGRAMRRLSLDELPQLFNVLRGDMTLVGPRPHAVEHDAYYAERIEGYLLRQRIKPGITGWAQVNGWRGQTETLDKMRSRVEHDLYYIAHGSFWLDCRILLRTLATFLFHKNAH